ncbi:MAG: type II secretion system F family protein [Patescibacteria group bacterium]
MEYLDTKHRKIDDTSKFNVVKSKLGTPVNKPAAITRPGKKPLKKTTKSRSKILLFGRVTMTDQMVFLDNLSTMIKAGLALAPALLTLTKEIKNQYFRKILEHLYEMIENGQSLSDGMKQYPKSFSDMIVSAVEVGENTGALAESLAHLADILSSQKKMRSKVISALIYPSVVVVAMVGISVFLAFFVFPQLIDTFNEAEVKLPAILLAVQFLTWAIQTYGWYVLSGALGLILIISLVFRLRAVRLWSATIILRFPFVGNLVRELNLSRFASNLNALLASGLSIVRSLEIVAKTVPNLKYRQEILIMAKELEKGKSLAASMADRPQLFTSLTVQLSHVGEDTGELENILKKISEYYEERVSNVLTNLSSIIEPILLVTVGVAVGFIALSVIAPMYELTQSFAQ